MASPASGAVCNTINPRLLPDDIAYIVDHAEDGVVFCDPQFLPIIAAIAPKLRKLCVPWWCWMMTASAQPPARVALYAYEDLLAEAAPIPAWPQFDENTASGLCYTSGTTGRPKGVLYSHRACVLHAMALNAADVVGLQAPPTGRWRSCPCFMSMPGACPMPRPWWERRS